MILHQIESLAAAGVKDIVLAVNYRPEVMIKVLQKVRCCPCQRARGWTDTPALFACLVVLSGVEMRCGEDGFADGPCSTRSNTA
jgi:NDP-sugar pyrophosphorylase family protein